MTMIDTTTLPLVPDECLWRWPARCWPAPTGSRGSRALVADVDPVLARHLQHLRHRHLAASYIDQRRRILLALMAFTGRLRVA